jgi:competence protein ComFC
MMESMRNLGKTLKKNPILNNLESTTRSYKSLKKFQLRLMPSPNFCYTVFMELLDLFFPKRCVGCNKFGDYICSDCFTRISFDVESICLVCNHPAIDGITHPLCRGKYTIDGSLASLAYKGITRRLVSRFKYQPYLSDLAHVLTDFFYEGLIQQEQFHIILKKESIFVPIPLHSEKYRARSYNQAEILAKNIGKRFSIPVYPVLNRVKKTQTQTTLTREKRRENIKGAFVLNKQNYEKIKGKQIVLVDDVITSGATILEAANVLKRNGVGKVWGIALAHGK